MNRLALFIPTIALMAVCSCIKRTEKITIFADSSARLETVIEGDPNDVHYGDAMPSEDSGWQVNDEIKTDQEGKETLTRKAVKQISSGQAYPASYATAGSRPQQLSLQFPTTLITEQHDDGTYYHFKRVYQHRPYAAVQYWQDKIMESDEMKAITQKESEEWTKSDIAVFAEALVEVEARKTTAFIEQAAQRLDDGIAQDSLLKVLRNVSKVYQDQELLTQVSELLEEEDAGKRGADLEQQLLGHVQATVASTLASSRVGPEVIAQLIEQYQLGRESFEITEDLGDEHWQVFLTLPGRIVAHNGDNELSRVEGYDYSSAEVIRDGAVAISNGHIKLRSSDHEGNTVGWEFDGKALQDRDVVLMATSFVPQAQGE